MVWPGLWDEGEGKGAEMVPVFGTDDPPPDEPGEDRLDGDGGDVELGNITGGDDGVKRSDGDDDRERVKVRVGWRMPYDLPLVPYGEDEKPWSAEVPCREPDRLGRRWMGYGA